MGRSTLFIYSVILILIAVSCSKKDQQDTTDTDVAEEYVVDQHDVDVDFTADITAVAEAYFAVYEAMLQQDSRNLSLAAQKLSTVLNNVDSSRLHAAAAQEWRYLAAVILEEAGEMTKDANRIYNEYHFYALSDLIVNIIERFGKPTVPVYQFFCNDAFSESGAYWLSPTSQVRNPYQVGISTTCGELIGEL